LAIRESRVGRGKKLSMMQVEVMDSGRKSSRPAADIGTSHRVHGSEGAFGLWTAAQYSVVLEYLPASKSQIELSIV
jgi:hypothetical protein